MTVATENWRDEAAAYARKHGLSARWTRALAAFAPQDVHVATDRPEIRAAQDEVALGDCLERMLGRDVDVAQAAMFRRRFDAVTAWLSDLADEHPEATLLVMGLLGRVREILACPYDRVLRVRSLVDFYYSQAGLLAHGVGPDSPPAASLFRDPRWSDIAAGLQIATLDGFTDSGPQIAHAMRIDPAHVDLVARVFTDEEAHSAAFGPRTAQLGAIAATSGGFFLHSEADIEPPSQRYDPVGLMIEDGKVISPPVFARGALVQRDGRWSIEVVGPDQARITVQKAAGPVALHDRGATFINRATHQSADVSGRIGVAVVGRKVVATAAGATLPVPLNGCVIVVPDDEDVRSITVGDSVSWRLDGVDQAMAGGPVLVRGGVLCVDKVAEQMAGTAPPVTFSRDETGDLNLLPRMAVGLLDDGRIVLLAVEGRWVDRALGLGLGNVAEAMIAMGCRTALNLDGGSSKRMILRGESLDVSTTEIQAQASTPARIRPVRSGLLVFAR